MKYKIIVLIIFISLILNINVKSTSTIVKNKTKLESNEELKLLEKYDYISGYTCDKVKVVNEDGTYNGTYNLEDYVSGVVSGETHILDDETTFMAISVAIRTYTLYVTNNCKNSIVNSEAAQVMSNPKNVSKKIKKAVSKTKGQVLTYNNKLIKSEYDSFYLGNGFYCDYKYCYSNYIKIGDNKNKIHKIKVPSSWKNDLAGGHGKGLSQYGAKYLSKEGYNYVDILKYFYADGVKISTTIKPNVSGLILNNGNVERNTRPLRNNSFYYINGEVNNNTLEGNSEWYATSRANEILKSINSTKKIDYLKSSLYCDIGNFKKEFDYKNPKPGSIISWGKHVAIIENVHDGYVDITESYIGLGYYGIELAHEYLNETGIYYSKETNTKDRKYNCEKNKSGCFKRTNSIPISDLEKRWGYNFLCYVYLKD